MKWMNWWSPYGKFIMSWTCFHCSPSLFSSRASTEIFSISFSPAIREREKYFSKKRWCSKSFLCCLMDVPTFFLHHLFRRLKEFFLQRFEYTAGIKRKSCANRVWEKTQSKHLSAKKKCKRKNLLLITSLKICLLYAFSLVSFIKKKALKFYAQ